MSTTKQFQWINRDTAARDLLLLYQYDLQFLRDRVLRLLDAIRSPAVIPNLLKIALDENTNESDGRIMGIISTTPGNFYLEDFEHLNQKYNLLFRARYPNFLKNHPINADQMLTTLWKRIELTNTAEKRCELYMDWLDCFPQVLTPPLLKLLEENPQLFTLETAAFLHEQVPEMTYDWLHNRWEEIIYLCLIDGIREKNLRSHYHYGFVRILENWPELKADLFQRCPAIIEEYDQKKIGFDQRFDPPMSIRSTFMWQELEMEFGLALQHGEDAITRFLWTRINSNEDVVYKAGATYFGGTVLDRYPSLIERYETYVEWNDDYWRDFTDPYPYDSRSQFPVRYEAANALRKIVTGSTWETFIRAYLKQPFNELPIWIAELTDQLSGIPTKPSPDKLLEQRPWFRAFIESSNKKS